MAVFEVTPSPGMTINTSLRVIHSGSSSFLSLLFLLSQPRSFSLPIPRGPLSLIIHRLLTAARTAKHLSPCSHEPRADLVSCFRSEPPGSGFPLARKSSLNTYPYTRWSNFQILPFLISCIIAFDIPKILESIELSSSVSTLRQNIKFTHRASGRTPWYLFDRHRRTRLVPGTDNNGTIEIRFGVKEISLFFPI